ncbi:glycosyltransferase [Halobacillus salinus]
MTVFNGESHIDTAIPSILNQTYSDFEFIIVNDGSTDSTFELLKEQEKKDRRIIVLDPGRLGFAKALNHGISKAKGKYIMRQDIDDISYPERFAKQVKHFEENPNVGVIGGYSILVDENRGERYNRMPPTSDNDIKRAMAKYIPFAHTIASFRKEAWDQVGGYPEAGNLVDLRFWLNIAKKDWAFHNIPSILGEHYVYGGSFWHKSFKYADRQKDLATVQKRVIKELGLPYWMYVYPIGRSIYRYMPKNIKKFTRRSVGGSRERDL